MVNEKVLRIKYNKGEYEWLEQHGYNIDQLGRRFDRLDEVEKATTQLSKAKQPKQKRKSWARLTRDVHINITPEMLQRLKEYCEGYSFNVSDACRSAISKYLDWADYEKLERART